MINYIRTSLKKGKYKILFLISLLILGFIAGVLYFIWQSEGMKDFLIGSISLSNINQGRINNLLEHLLLLPGMIFMLSLLLGLPLSLFYLFYQGLSWGFTSILICLACKMQGFIFLVKYFLLFEVIYLPLLIIFNLKMLDCSKNIVGIVIYRGDERIKRNFVLNLKKILIYLVIILLVDLFIYFISPWILKHLFTFN